MQLVVEAATERALGTSEPQEQRISETSTKRSGRNEDICQPSLPTAPSDGVDETHTRVGGAGSVACRINPPSPAPQREVFGLGQLTHRQTIARLETAIGPALGRSWATAMLADPR